LRAPNGGFGAPLHGWMRPHQCGQSFMERINALICTTK
jgi:hypothetical protein